MKWIEPNIEAVSTSDVIYYSEVHFETCSRICQVLQIDLFPDSNYKSYWHLNGSKWQEKRVSEEQRVNATTGAFSNEIIDKMASSPSNVLFSYSSGHLTGIVHFTNYASQQVYQSLYHNFYEFETNLREYLTLMGFTYDDVEKYYEHCTKKKKNNKFYVDQLELYRSEKFKAEAKELSDFQKLGFKEALLFSMSSYHPVEVKNQIGLSDVDEARISNLRNTIMHAKGITGSTSDLPYDFSSFGNFFNEVLSFRNAYKLLKKLRIEQLDETKIKFNNYTLSLLENLSDAEIKTYFYNRR